MRRFVVALAICGVIALAAASVGEGSGAKGKPTSGVVYAAITHTVGTTDYAAGNGTDKGLGLGAVTYTIQVLPNTKPGTLKLESKSVTFFTPSGELSGTGSATLTIGAKGKATVTGGTLSLTKGTGGQKGHRYVGTFTGSGSITTGIYVFHDKGTYY